MAPSISTMCADVNNEPSARVGGQIQRAPVSPHEPASHDHDRPGRRRPTAIIVANRAFAIANSRLKLIQHLMEKDWRVVVATTPDANASLLEEAGVIVETVEFHRGGFSISRDAGALLRLLSIYRRYQPTLVHHFNAKPVIFGTAAAQITPRAKIVNTITGLGHAFIMGGAAKSLVSAGYRMALRRADATIFQNRDDLKLFVEQHWVRSRDARLIVSSGIDTTRFQPLPPGSNTPSDQRVLMVGRLIWQKGVREFIEMAKILRERFPSVRFQLAGEWDPSHPDAVDRRFVDDAVASGRVEFLGFRADLNRLLPEISIFVLPSTYREGTPRVMLEAAACGIPVVAFDVPGSREAVLDNKTGFLVPPQHASALTDAVARLLTNDTLRMQFGRAGRAFVEQHFDTIRVTAAYVELYREVGIAV